MPEFQPLELNCDLGEGDVDEHDFAGQDVNAEVRVNAREDQAHQERRPEQ